MGDNRFLRLGRFDTVPSHAPSPARPPARAARYERQAAHAREVGLRADLPNRFDSPVVLMGESWLGRAEGGRGSGRLSSQG